MNIIIGKYLLFIILLVMEVISKIVYNIESSLRDVDYIMVTTFGYSTKIE